VPSNAARSKSLAVAVVIAVTAMPGPWKSSDLDGHIMAAMQPSTYHDFVRPLNFQSGSLTIFIGLLDATEPLRPTFCAGLPDRPCVFRISAMLQVLIKRFVSWNPFQSFFPLPVLIATFGCNVSERCKLLPEPSSRQLLCARRKLRTGRTRNRRKLRELTSMTESIYAQKKELVMTMTTPESVLS
jgi:hypothetical protein